MPGYFSEARGIVCVRSKDLSPLGNRAGLKLSECRCAEIVPAEGSNGGKQ